MLLGRLVDYTPDKIVDGQHRVQFLFDKFGQLAAEDRRALTPAGSTLVGLDRIVGQLNFPPTVVFTDNLHCRDAGIGQRRSQTTAAEPSDLVADDADLMRDLYPAFVSVLVGARRVLDLAFDPGQLTAISVPGVSNGCEFDVLGDSNDKVSTTGQDGVKQLEAEEPPIEKKEETGLRIPQDQLHGQGSLARAFAPAGSVGKVLDGLQGCDHKTDDTNLRKGGHPSADTGLPESNGVLRGVGQGHLRPVQAHGNQTVEESRRLARDVSRSLEEILEDINSEPFSCVTDRPFTDSLAGKIPAQVAQSREKPVQNVEVVEIPPQGQRQDQPNSKQGAERALTLLVLSVLLESLVDDGLKVPCQRLHREVLGNVLESLVQSADNSHRASSAVLFPSKHLSARWRLFFLQHIRKPPLLTLYPQGGMFPESCEVPGEGIR